MLRQAARSLGIPIAAFSISIGALAIAPSATATSTPLAGETIHTAANLNCKTTAYPKFPLPKGWYFGPKSGPKQSVSGYYSHRQDLCKWQQRMRDLGYTEIGKADGLYGPKTRDVAKKFQRDNNLKVDGLIGAETWKAAYKTWVSPCSISVKHCPK